VIRTAAILFRKDVLVEARTRESLTAMGLFSVMAFVLFHFGLDRDSIEGSLAAGVLWVTLLLATVLAVTRLFVAERDQGGFELILLAPIDRTAVFLGKAATLLAFLVAVEVVALPAFDILLLRGHAAGRDAGAAGGRGPGRHRTGRCGGAGGRAGG